MEVWFLVTCSFWLGLILARVGAEAQNKTLAVNNGVIPAIFVFGDSIVDTGNNNHLLSSAKSNFPPYGEDFKGHKPTGRFSNGKVPSDLLASKLGIKEYLPPYVGTNLSPNDLITGVNFASGGAGYDPLTSSLASAISLEHQLDLLRDYKKKIEGMVGEERANYIISESLHAVCLGSNDIANTYFLTRLRKNYDVPSYVKLLQGFASKFFEELINLGARKIVVVGVPPIGCVPSQRTLGGGILRECDARENQMALLVNSALALELQSLKTKYSGSRLALGNIYDLFHDIIMHPTSYGFEISDKGCCGTGLLEAALTCNSLTSSTCSDVSQYVFWDGYHPTEKAYVILVDHLYNKYVQTFL